jgi:hypothetical protein
VELRTPPEVLLRVFRRIRMATESLREIEAGERDELSEREARSQQMIETCRRVLADLGEGPGSTSAL